MEAEVKSGDVWAIADRFVLGCGDHEDDGHARLMAFMRKHLGDPTWRPDMIYCDLPWTDAIAMQFRRYAEAGMPKRFQDVAGVAMGARGAKGFLLPLLEIFAQVGLASRGDVYVEMGKENTQLTIDTYEAVGLKLIGQWPITYARGKSPCVLLQFNKNPAAAATGGGDPTGLDDGKDTIVWAAQRSLANARGWVYDCCTGKGTTPKVVLGTSPAWNFVGLELRPGAAGEAIGRAQRALKRPAQKVGEL